MIFTPFSHLDPKHKLRIVSTYRNKMTSFPSSNNRKVELRLSFRIFFSHFYQTIGSLPNSTCLCVCVLAARVRVKSQSVHKEFFSTCYGIWKLTHKQRTAPRHSQHLHTHVHNEMPTSDLSRKANFKNWDLSSCFFRFSYISYPTSNDFFFSKEITRLLCPMFAVMSFFFLSETNNNPKQHFFIILLFLLPQKNFIRKKTVFHLYISQWSLY